jgi:GDP-4-dehydro-6-deoxy-D-mannose reductase
MKSGGRLRVLVTGGTGFVGAHLIRFLKARAAAIAVLARGDNGLRDPGTEFYDVDVRDAGEVRSAVKEFQPTHVYHLAGFSAVDVSWREPRLNFEVNVGGAYNLFEAAMSLPSPPKILNVSTSQVYAPSNLPLSEDSAVSPDNPYAASKAMAEMITVQYRHHRVGEIITTRSFNHSGPGQSANFVLPSMARQFAEIRLGVRPPSITLGNIEVKRDFTDVRDVVRAYFMLLEHGSPGEVYNVCSGLSVRLADILKMFQSIAGVEAAIQIDPARLRTSDVLEMRGNSDKLREATGWLPQIPLMKTISDMLEDWTRRIRDEDTLVQS